MTEQRDLMKEQQTREDEITMAQEQRAIESEKRLAEAEQKINAVVQEDLTKLIIERQDTEKVFYNKHGHLQNNSNVTSNVKLQKLRMEPFNGDIIDYVRFSAQFNTEIDQSKIDDVSKLNYLLSLTKGKPRD